MYVFMFLQLFKYFLKIQNYLDYCLKIKLNLLT